MCTFYYVMGYKKYAQSLSLRRSQLNRGQVSTVLTAVKEGRVKQ